MRPYSEQWQKITTAYLNNQLHPMSNCACFVGNLLDRSDGWAICRSWYGIVREQGTSSPESFNALVRRGEELITSHGYTPLQIVTLEANFVKIVGGGGSYTPGYEDRLYKAMVSTLEMLKEIHEANGEVIEQPVLQKRLLQPA